VLLFLLLLLLVDFTSIVLSRIIILFFNYTIFLILYSLGVSINANSEDGWLLKVSALLFLYIPPITVLFLLIVIILATLAVD
jgi:hypothetical protein